LAGLITAAKKQVTLLEILAGLQDAWEAQDFSLYLALLCSFNDTF
jgi:hypothetical protein